MQKREHPLCEDSLENSMLFWCSVSYFLHSCTESTPVQAYIRSFEIYQCEARTLLGLGVSRCQTRVVSDTDTTPTHIITWNHVIFSNHYRCWHVSVRVVSASVLHIISLRWQ